MTGAEGIGSYIRGALARDGRDPGLVVSKIGYGDDTRSHDCAIVERTVDGKALRYVVVGLGSQAGNRRSLEDLFIQLDQLILDAEPLAGRRPAVQHGGRQGRGSAWWRGWRRAACHPGSGRPGSLRCAACCRISGPIAGGWCWPPSRCCWRRGWCWGSARACATWSMRASPPADAGALDRTALLLFGVVAALGRGHLRPLLAGLLARRKGRGRPAAAGLRPRPRPVAILVRDGADRRHPVAADRRRDPAAVVDRHRHLAGHPQRADRRRRLRDAAGDQPEAGRHRRPGGAAGGRPAGAVRPAGEAALARRAGTRRRSRRPGGGDPGRAAHRAGLHARGGGPRPLRHAGRGLGRRRRCGGSTAGRC